MTPEQRKEYETLLHYLDRQTGTQICKEAAQAIRELMNASPASVRAAALEEERKAFEEHTASEVNGVTRLHRFPSGAYGDERTQTAWRAWQARATLSAAPAGGLGEVDSKSDSFGAILAQFMTPKRIKDLRRFDEFTQDGEGYDIDAEDMDALADIGLIRRTSGRHFQFTDLGLMALLHYAAIAAAQGEGK